MREFIERLLNEYVSATKENFMDNAIGAYIRNKVPVDIYSTGIVSQDQYIIKGSVGQGNWAQNPWIAIFDKQITTSATEGVYIVFLLSSDGESLYLTLNQACTNYMKNNGKKEAIQLLRNRANKVATSLDARSFLKDSNINLRSKVGNLGQLYQAGTIFYKEYKRGQVPNEDILRADLREMVEIYTEYVRRKDEFSDDSSK